MFQVLLWRLVVEKYLLPMYSSYKQIYTVSQPMYYTQLNFVWCGMKDFKFSTTDVLIIIASITLFAYY